MKEFRLVSPELDQYCIEKSNSPDKICAELYEYTKANVSQSEMLIGPLEAGVLATLIQSVQAKRVLEFGTYTGYSALAMAQYLPDDGELVTLDISEETTKIAKDYWAKSPHGKKIKLLLGPALETTKNLRAPFDFVFVDADKANYKNYVEIALELLSPNGIIACDNVLWKGEVVAEKTDNLGERMKEFNEYIASRKDLFRCLLPVRDGIYLIRKMS